MSISKLSITRAACWQSWERCFLYSLGNPPASRAENGGVCPDLGLISSSFRHSVTDRAGLTSVHLLHHRDDCAGEGRPFLGAAASKAPDMGILLSTFSVSFLFLAQALQLVLWCLFHPPKRKSNVDGNFWQESGCTVLSERGLCPGGLILNSPCLDSILKSNFH